jgi:hypothetical protein
MWPTVSALGIILVILGPFLFRLSRTTWLSLFVHYDRDATERWQKEKK